MTPFLFIYQFIFIFIFLQKKSTNSLDIYVVTTVV